MGELSEWEVSEDSLTVAAASVTGGGLVQVPSLVAM